MAIGIGPSSPHQLQHGVVPGGGASTGGGQEPEVPLGVRGVASVGSGLRTGVTVVRHAIRTGDELGEARHQAREAAVRERLDHEAAEASTALHEEHHRRLDAIAPLRSSPESVPPDSAATPGHASAQGDASRQTIQAAVAAGEAGDTAPRGAYLDLSV